MADETQKPDTEDTVEFEELELQGEQGADATPLQAVDEERPIDAPLADDETENPMDAIERAIDENQGQVGGDNTVLGMIHTGGTRDGGAGLEAGTVPTEAPPDVQTDTQGQSPEAQAAGEETASEEPAARARSSREEGAAAPEEEPTTPPPSPADLSSTADVPSPPPPQPAPLPQRRRSPTPPPPPIPRPRRPLKPRLLPPRPPLIPPPPPSRRRRPHPRKTPPPAPRWWWLARCAAMKIPLWPFR
ncbi:hypothetical protein [Pararhodospirillum photometricum]|uniref:hypothetical protein n=1 Tax=Pararhodospirillum photometricum TaxID=1084 RepID=UPI0002DFCEB9|nr:hypothetical protein [Pararhodospirillum photometricum]